MEEATDISTMIEDCKKRDEKLTAWEHDFIVSIESQYEVRGLTEKQINRLNVIWDKVTM